MKNIKKNNIILLSALVNIININCSNPDINSMYRFKDFLNEINIEATNKTIGKTNTKLYPLIEGEIKKNNTPSAAIVENILEILRFYINDSTNDLYKKEIEKFCALAIINSKTWKEEEINDFIRDIKKITIQNGSNNNGPNNWLKDKIIEYNPYIIFIIFISSTTSVILMFFKRSDKNNNNCNYCGNYQNRNCINGNCQNPIREGAVYDPGL